MVGGSAAGYKALGKIAIGGVRVLRVLIWAPELCALQ